MSVVTIPSAQSFFDVLVARWMSRVKTAQMSGDGVIIVPNRRSAMQLSEAFLRFGDGTALLLPRVIAFSDFEAAFESMPGIAIWTDPDHVDAFPAHPPACDPMRRMAALATLVLRSQDAFAVRPGLDQAWKLAQALAELMDDAERVECDLAARLPEAAEGQYAAHWERSLQFLNIVTTFWPAFLEENGVANPIARQTALIKSLSRHWQQQPPEGHVWAVGFSDVITSVGVFLRTVASLPEGCVVLPGLDQALPESMWAELPESHPQYGLKQILLSVEWSRHDVVRWGGDPETEAETPEQATLERRVGLMRAALIPAAGVTSWMRDRTPVDVNDLTILNCEDAQQEARAIAMVLREGLTDPKNRVALITPDRQIARRVAVQLLRYGIVADDSAGEPLMRTPAAVFLRLLAEAQVSDYAPVPLLALLKHPFAAAGLTPGACRASARRLERMALRGPAPPSGLEGIRQRCRAEEHPEAALADRPDLPLDPHDFLDRLIPILQPGTSREPASIPALLTQLIATAERLAETPEASGAARLWAGEDGHALSSHLSDLLLHTDILGEHVVSALPSFLAASMDGKAVMGQRVLKGREGGHLHPRVFILGLIEARLQRFDIAVVAGLEEGVWPKVAEPGPWLSRPMRQRIGLRSPECAIGADALDFVSAALSAPKVVLSHAARRDGAPAVASRWLVRLQAYLGGRRQTLPKHPAATWQAQLDQPAGAAIPATQPRPRPPVHLRPRRLSVTEVDTWLADPYAIYARHILKLRPLEPLNAAVGRAEVGMIVHEALAVWVTSSRLDAAHLTELLHERLARAPLAPSAKAWWRGRLTRVAEGAVRFQALRAEGGGESWVEVAGRIHFETAAGRFDLTARADRIDRDALGRINIIDYKTGRMPRQKDTERGWASQLWLEAAIAAAGGFPGITAQDFLRLEYWRLSGQAAGDRIMTIADAEKNTFNAEIEMRLARFKAWVARFDEVDTPYIAQPHPRYAPVFDNYGQLARVREWRLPIGEDA